MPERRIVILAEGYFGELEAKTASGLIKYKPEEVVAVIDSTKEGKTSQDVLGFGGNIPIIKNLESSFKHKPNALLIGIAPRGGKLPNEWRKAVISALENGMDIISGLHDILSQDPELATLSRFKGGTIWDLRKADDYRTVSTGKPELIRGKVVLTVGTDCKVGKMITAIEITKEAKKIGFNPYFIATGQTGIIISGEGIPIDSIVGDFMSGSLEEFVIEKSKIYNLLLVEGQGTIIHPGYSGVSLALIHGCLPDAMILCHFPGRKKLNNYDIIIPPLKELILLHQEIAKYVKPSKIVGISLNTSRLTDDEAKREIKITENQTGLPATDPVRYGCEKLIKAIEFLKMK